MAFGKTNFPDGSGGGLGSLYITTTDVPISCDRYGPNPYLTTTYAYQVGNYIYLPVFIQVPTSPATYAPTVSMMILDITSASFPARYTTNLPGNQTLNSVYLDSGVIYINHTDGYNPYHTAFTITGNSWGSYAAGYHTSGTVINSVFTLSGFKYEPALNYYIEPDNRSYLLYEPLYKITKI